MENTIRWKSSRFYYWCNGKDVVPPFILRYTSSQPIQFGDTRST